MAHESHPDIIKRLKRAEGHLRSLIAMMEAGRPCLDLAQQLHAVEAAITNAKRELIHDHMDHCMGDAVKSGSNGARAALAEFKALAKYL
jgi:DNA-binding FrmR family transcriptional regulator